MDLGHVCLCLISQYVDAEEFVSSETYGMEGRKDYPHHCNVQSEGEGCYVRLAMDSALSKCFSQGVLVPSSQIVAVMEHTSQSHTL